MGELIKKPVTLVDIYLQPTIISPGGGIIVQDPGFITGTKRATNNRGANYIYQLSGFFIAEHLLGLPIIGVFQVDITPIGILTYDAEIQFCSTTNNVNSHNYLGTQGVKIDTVGPIIDISVDNPNPGGAGGAVTIYYSLIIFST